MSAYYGNAVGDFLKVGFVFLGLLLAAAVVVVALVAVLIFGVASSFVGYVARRQEIGARAWQPLRAVAARTRAIATRRGPSEKL